MIPTHSRGYLITHSISIRMEHGMKRKTWREWPFHLKEATSATPKLIDQGATTETFVISPLTAEALAIRLAMTKARQKGFSKISILSLRDLNRSFKHINSNQESIWNLTGHSKLHSSISFRIFPLCPQIKKRYFSRFFGKEHN